ncbi:MAG TPA: exo-alpha-sialidase [Thermoanaerobaculia bacterium]|nr:exo-alpha-sialidase [Thermoanaerobaculia bacterium]
MAAKKISVRNGDVLLLVGTMKGAFLLKSDRSRRRWERSGPHFPGSSVYAIGYDGRNDRHRIWAAPKSLHWGAELCSSDDFGAKWSRPEVPRIAFPKETGATLAHIWQIEPGLDDEPERIFVGVEPSALFESRDGGESWSLNEGLWNHPHRAKWMPGGGGLCLHTILTDPARRDRLTIATSTGGVYRTDDNGETWRARNRGIQAYFLTEKDPEFGQCVHKVVRHPSRPDRMFLQHHFGLYRSDDGGDTWREASKGVPSDFGFPMAMHPRDTDTVYIVPLQADQFRCPPEGKLRVYRTRDGARSWKPLTRGLPQKDCYDTVLRDAMAVDEEDPAGVYFGTRNGWLYGSRDEGQSWSAIEESLPPVTCVRAVTIRSLGKARPARRRRKAA